MTESTPRDRALAGEVVKLTDERLAQMQQYPYMHPDWPRAITELIAARKEIERLRTALKDIARPGDFTLPAEIARVALEATSSSEGPTP